MPGKCINMRRSTYFSIKRLWQRNCIGSSQCNFLQYRKPSIGIVNVIHISIWDALLQFMDTRKNRGICVSHLDGFTGIPRYSHPRYSHFRSFALQTIYTTPRYSQYYSSQIRTFQSIFKYILLIFHEIFQYFYKK